MATMQHKIFFFFFFFAFVSLLKRSRRLVCSVRFVFVSTFNLQRGRAFVFWNHQLEQTGCLCKVQSSGRPRVSEENVGRIQESFECSPRRSTRRASRELGILQPTVWRVLRRRLLFKPYRLQLVQALRPNDKRYMKLSPSFLITLYFWIDSIK
jgi:hypothetical protein